MKSISKHAQWCAVVTPLVLLTACGGGGGSSDAQGNVNTSGNSGVVTGTAATGRALANADILAQCASGQFSTRSTNDGQFSLTLPTDQVCVLSVDNNGTSYRAIHVKQSHLNLTPLTEMLTRYLVARSGLQANASLENLVQSPAFQTVSFNDTLILEAAQAVQALLKKEYQIDVGTDFLTESLISPSANNANQNQADRLLDQLSASGGLDAQGAPITKDLDTLAQQAAARLRTKGLPVSAGPEAIRTSGNESSAMCFNPDQLNVGYVSDLNYTGTSGGHSANINIKIEATKNVNFANQASTELKTTLSLTNASYMQYVGKNAEQQIVSFGDVVQGTDNTGVTTRTETVYSPALIVDDFNLKTGESLTQNTVDQLTITNSSTGQSNSVTQRAQNHEETATFVGPEVINVPAGQFLSCKVSNTTKINGQLDNTSTTWYAVGSGITLKDQAAYSDGTNLTLELNGGTLNGTAIQ